MELGITLGITLHLCQEHQVPLHLRQELSLGEHGGHGGRASDHRCRRDQEPQSSRSPRPGVAWSLPAAKASSAPRGRVSRSPQAPAGPSGAKDLDAAEHGATLECRRKGSDSRGIAAKSFHLESMGDVGEELRITLHLCQERQPSSPVATMRGRAPRLSCARSSVTLNSTRVVRTHRAPPWALRYPRAGSSSARP
jgi:hypothetical protein